MDTEAEVTELCGRYLEPVRAWMSTGGTPMRMQAARPLSDEDLLADIRQNQALLNAFGRWWIEGDPIRREKYRVRVGQLLQDDGNLDAANRLAAEMKARSDRA